jgi:hypothetical protein
MRLAVSSPIKGQKSAKAMIHHILLLSNLDMRTSEYRRYLLKNQGRTPSLISLSTPITLVPTLFVGDLVTHLFGVPVDLVVVFGPNLLPLYL